MISVTATDNSDPDRFRPPPGLGHRHVQTMLTSMPLYAMVARGRAKALLDASREEIIDCSDGVRLMGVMSAQVSPARGLAILLHGWEGCADSSYMLSAGATLHERGYDVFRLNFRDHGQTHALNEELFHSCRIDEVVNAVKAIQARHRAPRTVLVGFSLGGNFALRVAVRAVAAGIDLERVVAVCPVLRPRNTMHALETGLWVYRRYFLKRWRRSLAAKARSFPGRYDFGDLRRLRTLSATTEFLVTRYSGFPDLDTYLDGYAITGNALEGLDVPARIIAAEDDPVIPARDLPDLAPGPALSVSLFRRGGHCGFVAGYSLRNWLDDAIARLLEAPVSQLRPRSPSRRMSSL